MAYAPDIQGRDDGPAEGNGATAILIYGLYLAGLAFPLLLVVGVVVAYLAKEEAPDWLRSHYVFQIWTFWIGVVAVILVFLTIWFLIGYLIALGWSLLLIIRCVRGILRANGRRPIGNPRTWLF